MSSSSISRCVTARRTPGCAVAEKPTPSWASLARASLASRSSATTLTWTKLVCTCSRSTGTPAAGCHERLDLLERPAPAPGGVMRVLDRDDPRPRRVCVVAPANHPLHLVRPETTRLASDRPGHQAGVNRRAPELREEEMGILL